jgi:hypothetical protein
MKTVSFNIDIDPLLCYYSIHGIKDVPVEEHDPLVSLSIPRFLKIFEKYGVKATFFVTASGLQDNDYKVLEPVVKNGHEIANHSYSHDYKFSLMTKEEIEKDIRKNHEIIKSKLGVECRGFRSPGYNSSKNVVKALRNMNYAYDSSLFPSFFYNLAKWLIIKKKKLAGLYSSSIINSFGDSFASTKPALIEDYITDRKTEGKLVEFPVTTLFYPFGIPLIGTSINTFPKFLLDIMLKFSRLKDFVNIEMHAIDMCDLSDGDAFKPIEKMQFDLKVPIAEKERRISQVVEYYLEKGYKVKTLYEISSIKKGEIS